MASYDSVKGFAEKVVSELDRIDAVVENAGVGMRGREMAEGNVVNLTLNVFSTFLLAVLLLPKVSESAKNFGILPRLVVVASWIGFYQKEIWMKIKENPVALIDEENSQVPIECLYAALILPVDTSFLSF